MFASLKVLDTIWHLRSLLISLIKLFIIHYSNVRPANISLEKNIRLNSLTIPSIVKSKGEISKNKTLVKNNNSLMKNRTSVPILDTLDLVGGLFSYLLMRMGNAFEQELL